MAKIYGCSESEKKVVKICSYDVKKFDEINETYEELEEELKKKNMDKIIKLDKRHVEKLAAIDFESEHKKAKRRNNSKQIQRRLRKS